MSFWVTFYCSISSGIGMKEIDNGVNPELGFCQTSETNIYKYGEFRIQTRSRQDSWLTRDVNNRES